jgi:hypothetical protein
VTPGELLRVFEEVNISLYVKGGTLRVLSGPGTLIPELRKEARHLRQVLLDDWLCPNCDVISRVFYGIPPNVLCRACDLEARHG